MIYETIAINYCYYDNRELFEEVIQFYEPFKDDFTFTVIDDGSPNHPLTREWVPEWWNIWIQPIDYGWGNEMCKNILMKKTKNQWNALMDLDLVIDLQDDETYSLMKHDFIKYYKDIHTLSAQYQFRDNAATDDREVNSFIVSHEAWMRHTYGYDTAFGYTYGYDYTLFLQIDYSVRIPGKLKKLREQGAPGEWHAKGNMKAFAEFEALQDKYVKTGFYTRQNGWTSQRERNKYTTPMPEVYSI